MPPEKDKHADPLRATLTMVAPGTPLREGLERILRADTGALVVLGEGPAVDSLLSGGFRLDADFTAQRLSELAKMDGAMVVTPDAGRIVWANVHLVPDHSIPTLETGTRHRTAERVSKQAAVPVVSVSQSMRIVTLYVNGAKYVLEEIPAIITRANNALGTLERYKQRLDEVASTLSALEVEDLATLRDVLTVIQRIEMVRRIAAEIDALVDELGTEGRLLRLQLEELMGGVETDRQLVVRDYLVPKRGRSLEAALRELEALSPEELLDPMALARLLNHPATAETIEQTVSPKGYRLLSKIPRLPANVVERIVTSFGKLPAVLSASIEDLLGVEGVGAARAATIKEGLARLAESSILERYL